MRTQIIVAATAVLSCTGPTQTENCVASASSGIEVGNVQSAIPVLEKGALEGDERCKFILGMWSLAGTGMKRDSESAGRWLSERFLAPLGTESRARAKTS